MAEKVLFNVAGGILGSLAGPLIAEEFRMVRRVKREIEKLQNTVSAIQAVLLHAEELRATNPLVDHWLGRLDDVIYEADDLLDAVSTKVLRRKEKKAGKVRIFFSESNQLAFRFKMGHKIKGIREKLDAIAAALKDFNFVPRLVETPVRVTGRVDTYSFVLEQHVIGRKNDKEAVIKSLLDPNIEESLSILPIVGIGGLGKTTLAQLVYNGERFQNFDIKMWVCISNNFNVKFIIEKILESAKVKPQGVQMEQLVDCLRKNVVAKKIILILDDVWNEDIEKWFELKSLLTSDVVGNKILITTRSNEVARITYTVKPYILKGLREEESWDLFKKMAFNGQESRNLSITMIGKEIVRKCGGVPLALGVMGRMLFGKDSIDEWLAFKDNQLSKISQKTILSTLKLSYDILPSPLKHCFVYCSLFPKNYEFNETMLIRLWIAQGFVKFENNGLLEDTGHDYFMQLVSRLFFHKAFASHFSMKEDNCEENIYVFKMHDLMHDLAILMAGPLIVTKLDNIGKDAIQKAHHISFHGLNNISGLYEVSRTRTLIYFRDTGYYDSLDDEDVYIPLFLEDCDPLNVKKVVSSFKLLRVLILGESCFGLNNIGSLIHLRYLDLTGLLISELPNSITRLINLETLILLGCFNLQNLPKGISKLVNLRNLDNSDCYVCRLPRRIVQLTNLQTLGLFVITSASSSKHDARFEEISQLKNLRGKIQIYDQRSLVQGTACYSRTIVDPKVKSILNVLKLEGEYVQQTPMMRGFQTYIKEPISPRPLSFLSTLTSLVALTIKGVPGCKHLPPLCQLPSLEEVHLFRLPQLEYILGYSDKNQLSSSTPSKTFFPSLKFLEINKCYNLKGWLWSDSPKESKADNSGDNLVMEHHSPLMFSCLSKLLIYWSLWLATMPLFPNTLADLCLNNVSWKPYLAKSFFTPLSKLKKLELIAVSVIETLPTEGLQYLISLENLYIHSCEHLKSLCLGSLHLTALKSLILSNCKDLEFINDKDAAQWRGLGNLLTVHFGMLPKLVSLPWYLQHATTLVDLHIKDCENLTGLPEWICNYQSLKELKIVRCSRLTYLPERVETLLSLDRIYIQSCPGIRNIVRPPGYSPPPCRPCPYPPCSSETS